MGNAAIRVDGGEFQQLLEGDRSLDDLTAADRVESPTLTFVALPSVV
jgi:hypothetical protein